MKKSYLFAFALLVFSHQSNAATVSVDPGAAWQGFMNVFNLPSAGGAYQFGSPWGVSDLTATFSGPVLTLGPNTIGDPNEYWYQNTSGLATAPNFGGPGQQGNKIMEANMYVETTGVHVGTNLVFTGEVLSNTFTGSHSGIVFIKDFAPDYSSVVETTAPLSPGVFSISLNTINDPARHVQYGFQVKGVNGVRVVSDVVYLTARKRKLPV
jgi:hypothetical protein